MSFRLYDEDGYVGDLASIGGYNDLLDTVTKGNYPPLRQMLENGETQEPMVVLEELKKFQLSGLLADSSVRDTVSNFQRLMTKEVRKEIVLIAE